MEIKFAGHLSVAGLLKLSIPSVIMMVFTSIYGVVDGFCVSNYVGKAAFTAVNFIIPFLMMLGAMGFMFGTGGGALIARSMGEGRHELANRLFSMLVYVSLGLGVVLAALGLVFLEPVSRALGAEGELLENSIRYGRVILAAIPAYILQYEFQCLFATAGKARLGLYVTVASGLTNIVLDMLFVAVLDWGLEGAAVATAISQLVGGLFPLWYFARPNDSLLRLGGPSFDGRALGKICLNGSSELMSNISMSLVNMLYNAQLLKYTGEDGVAAYGVLMYVSLVFQAIFIGYSVGTAPAVSYHFGAGNRGELHSILGKSLRLIAAFSGLMFASACCLSRPLSMIFVAYDAALLDMTVRAFYLFAISFLFAGVAIYGSSFFTALNDGPVSAAISFLRTLLFQTAAVLLLPLLWGETGIWLSAAAAEIMAAGVTAAFLSANRQKYGY